VHAKTDRRRIGQHQTKQIRGALDMTHATKGAMFTRQRIDRLRAAQSRQKAGKHVGLS
jgi:hypothetical protein